MVADPAGTRGPQEAEGSRCFSGVMWTVHRASCAWWLHREISPSVSTSTKGDPEWPLRPGAGVCELASAPQRGSLVVETAVSGAQRSPEPGWFSCLFCRTVRPEAWNKKRVGGGWSPTLCCFPLPREARTHQTGGGDPCRDQGPEERRGVARAGLGDSDRGSLQPGLCCQLPGFTPGCISLGTLDEGLCSPGLGFCI